jgi:glycosyltransferase involved in cell wall biosynthesis
MKVVVFSHKKVWQQPESKSGFATDGGFAFHMDAISQIFESTVVVVPVLDQRIDKGEVFIQGHNLKVFPLKAINASGLKRKLLYIPWAIRNIFRFNALINHADAVHVPIPSDIGTLGMVLAKLKGKNLLVRYCGNWLIQKTTAEKLWRWFMEKYAGGRNVMLATGFESSPPSQINPNIHWIFSSSLTSEEIAHLSQNLPVLNTDNPRIIIVCRMDDGKGVDLLIKAIKLVKTEYPTIHLDLVGEGSSLNKFKNLVSELNLNGNVTFHGKLNHDQVLVALQNAHIFCFPTASEGFPKVVLEALASGLPVISTPVSAIIALLNSGGGILVENTDPETIANAIVSILARPGSYTDMQKKAIETAKNFSLENWRDTIKQHLQQEWKGI